MSRTEDLRIDQEGAAEVREVIAREDRSPLGRIRAANRTRPVRAGDKFPACGEGNHERAFTVVFRAPASLPGCTHLDSVTWEHTSGARSAGLVRRAA